MENIKLSQNENSIIILDQTRLPNEERYIELSSKEEMYQAIYELKVRGAPAIGIFAAYAVYVLAKQLDEGLFNSELKNIADYLIKSRPTAVNLKWAVNRMLQSVNGLSKEMALKVLSAECRSIHNEDIAICKSISEYGLTLIKDGSGILTHCNAGALATSKYGTGLGALLLGAERGMNFNVYCDETRPLLQGARLTAYELMKAGINTTLICDNMVSLVMKEKKIDACFVGCDRVAANGDTANKIGTSGVAIIAKHYGIPFYVFCPTPTIDFNSRNGDDIEIELRNGEEICSIFFKEPIAPSGIKCYNPAFDITCNSLITAIITENGICYPPYDKNLSLFKSGIIL